MLLAGESLGSRGNPIKHSLSAAAVTGQGFILKAALWLCEERDLSRSLLGWLWLFWWCLSCPEGLGKESIPSSSSSLVKSVLGN